MPRSEFQGLRGFGSGDVTLAGRHVRIGFRFLVCVESVRCVCSAPGMILLYRLSVLQQCNMYSSGRACVDMCCCCCATCSATWSMNCCEAICYDINTIYWYGK